MTERLGYSPREAAAVAGVGRTTVYGWIGSGLLRARKAGKRTIITSEDLRDCLSSLPSIEVKAPGGRAWLAAQAARGKTRGPAVGTAAMLLLLLATLQIWPPWAPVVTLRVTPAPSAITETAVAQAFPAWRATAHGAGGRGIGPAIGAIDLRDTETVERAQAASAAPTAMSAATTSPEAA
jgi:excisionase family DNA binding protein